MFNFYKILTSNNYLIFLDLAKIIFILSIILFILFFLSNLLLLMLNAFKAIILNNLIIFNIKISYISILLELSYIFIEYKQFCKIL